MPQSVVSFGRFLSGFFSLVAAVGCCACSKIGTGVMRNNVVRFVKLLLLVLTLLLCLVIVLYFILFALYFAVLLYGIVLNRMHGVALFCFVLVLCYAHFCTWYVGFLHLFCNYL